MSQAQKKHIIHIYPAAKGILPILFKMNRFYCIINARIAGIIMNPMIPNKTSVKDFEDILAKVEDCKKGLLDCIPEIDERVSALGTQHLISSEDQKTIHALLTQLKTDLKAREECCQKISALISSVAKAAQPAGKGATGEANLKIETPEAKAARILKEACEAARMEPTKALEIIKEYGLTKEQERVEIAKAAAGASNTGKNYVIEHFAEFNIDIQNQKARVEIAKAATLKSRVTFSSEFHIFNITDEKDRVEIAKFEAQQSSPYFGDNFQNYNISNPQDRFEIAKISAKKRPNQISEYIKNFNIPNEADRFEIAKIAAQGGLYGAQTVLNFFANYDITNEQYRVAILKLAAVDTSDYIRHFNIKSEDDRVAIAKIAVAGHSGASDRIANYDISNEQTRIEIAKLAASLYEHHLPASIKSYNISQEQDRIEVAKIAAELDGASFSNYIERFEIKDKKALVEIMLTAIRHDPNYIEHIIAKFEKFLAGKDQKPTPTSNSFKELREQAQKTASGDVGVDKTLSSWITCYEWMCKAYQLSDAQIKERLPYAEQIVKFEEPAMRYVLAGVLAKYPPPQKPNEMPDHSLLFRLLLEPLQNTAALTAKQWNQIFRVLESREYRDSVKKEIAVHGLYQLLDCKVLTDHERGTFLKSIFIPEKGIATVSSVNEQLQMLEAIILSKNEALLKEVGSQADKKSAIAGDAAHQIDLERILNKIFTQSLGLGHIPNFQTKYMQTIGKAREPLALLIYAAKLRSLSWQDQQRAIGCLNNFANAVLEGNYQSWRYQLPKESHLAQVFQGRQQVLKIWQEGERCKLDQLIKSEAASSPQKVFDPVEHLNLRICVDKHIPQNELPNLEKWLTHPDQRKKVLEDLGKFLAGNKLEQSAHFDPKNEQQARIFKSKLEAALIKALAPERTFSQKATEIKNLMPLLEKIYGTSFPRFVKDVQELQDLLAADVKTASIEEYTVEDTDHWEDMLLIGTEVAGSCQHIKDHIQYNKCLLGYIADGKNRAIVVKDAKGKIVARRIMRLLWDHQAQKPVIYQERLYANPGVPSKAFVGIDKLFAKRAKALGLPLVRTMVASQNLNPYPHPLSSSDSPAPFEYVDAGGVGVTDGRYIISAQNIATVIA